MGITPQDPWNDAHRECTLGPYTRRRYSWGSLLVAAHDRGVKKAPFVVLIGARMPSVLAEIGFLSNPKDEGNLIKPEYRQKVAESLYRGIAQYSQSLSHFEVASTGAK